jgi:hypothetical protein
MMTRMSFCMAFTPKQLFLFFFFFFLELVFLDQETGDSMCLRQSLAV